ncbi:MAG: DUF6994 family protein [Ruminococcus sp.]
MIDVYFDFTTDTDNFWNGFWDRNDGLGASLYDPDTASKKLQEYHKILWSRKLPNGEIMNLNMGSATNYLNWKDFRFGSDSIIVTLRYKKYKHMIEQVKQKVPNYKKFYEDFIRKSYTIGGMIIFPKHKFSINQVRGTNSFISDRWDLTLECIRRYYLGEKSPLYNTLLNDKNFFELFKDFKGYVDFFFLQDCVSSDYSKVDIWEGTGLFNSYGLPETLDGYFSLLENEMNFLKKRNKRIELFFLNNNI